MLGHRAAAGMERNLNMPTIQITDEVFGRLQAIARPLVDTSSDVLSRLLDFYENRKEPEAASKTNNVTIEGREGSTFSYENRPPLVHTKLLDWGIGSTKADENSWNAMVRHSLMLLYRKHNSFEEVKKAAAANLIRGKKDDRGYKYIQELGFSYQGVSAEDAIAIVARASRDLGVDSWFEFVWRDKDGAYRPGERARVVISAK